MKTYVKNIYLDRFLEQEKMPAMVQMHEQYPFKRKRLKRPIIFMGPCYHITLIFFHQVYINPKNKMMIRAFIIFCVLMVKINAVSLVEVALLPYKTLLEEGTYQGQDWSSFERIPQSRYETFKSVFEHFVESGGSVVVELGKAKYSIPYFLDHGYEIMMDEYQVILRKSKTYD